MKIYKFLAKLLGLLFIFYFFILIYVFIGFEIAVLIGISLLLNSKLIYKRKVVK